MTPPSPAAGAGAAAGAADGGGAAAPRSSPGAMTEHEAASSETTGSTILLKTTPERATAAEDSDLESDSDETQQEVEVMFSPGKANMYRRKSSMVSSEAAEPMVRRPSKQTDCIVHQFLESQRRAHGSSSESSASASGNANGYAKSAGSGSHESTSAQRSRAASIQNGKTTTTTLEVPAAALARTNGAGAEKWQREMSTTNITTTTTTAGAVDVVAAEGEDETHSRLLTKKELSDMAWGVRELSRRLGTMRIRFSARTIFVLTKVFDQELVPKTRRLVRWLLSREREVRYTVYVEASLQENRRFDAAGLLGELREEHAAAAAAAAVASSNGSGGAGSSGSGSGGGGSGGEEENLARRLRFWDEDMCRTRPHMFDFVITLGGDGTVLYASWLFQRIVPPVLSFSLGSLGFLTKFDFEKHEEILEAAFRTGVTISLRLRFEGTVMRAQRRAGRVEGRRGGVDGEVDGVVDGEVNGERKDAVNGEDKTEAHGDKDEVDSTEAEDEERKRDLVEELIGQHRDDETTHRPDATYQSLNEIVVDRGPNPTLSYLEVFGDDEHFTSVLADGICVSTPTGSTAYNLAAGGSLCHPENPVMLVTSICAHTLSFRPIILPDTIVLRVGVPYDARTSAWASFDGRERVELRPGDYVTVSASRYPFASVQRGGRRSEDWIESISGKLGWNRRDRQKAYSEWEK